MQLSINDLQKLRNAGVLGVDENAIKEGDVVVAVNVVSGVRRLIETSTLMLEANKKLLKD